MCSRSSRGASAPRSAKRSRASWRRRLPRCSCAEAPVTPAPAKVDPGVFREVFDLASVGMLMLSPDGLIHVANEAFCRMIGYTRAEVEGRSYRGMVRMDDVPADEEELRLVREGNEPPVRYD